MANRIPADHLSRDFARCLWLVAWLILATTFVVWGGFLALAMCIAVPWFVWWLEQHIATLEPTA